MLRPEAIINSDRMSLPLLPIKEIARPSLISLYTPENASLLIILVRLYAKSV
jgi:hypothetical protein